MSAGSVAFDMNRSIRILRCSGSANTVFAFIGAYGPDR